MSHSLLSASVGVPIALAALSLWFLVEFCTVSHRHKPSLLLPSALLATAVLLVIIVARFATYT